MASSLVLTAYLALQRSTSSQAVAGRSSNFDFLVLDSVPKIFAKHLACLIRLLEFEPLVEVRCYTLHLELDFSDQKLLNVKLMLFTL